MPSIHQRAKAVIVHQVAIKILEYAPTPNRHNYDVCVILATTVETGYRSRAVNLIDPHGRSADARVRAK